MAFAIKGGQLEGYVVHNIAFLTHIFYPVFWFDL